MPCIRPCFTGAGNIISKEGSSVGERGRRSGSGEAGSSAVGNGVCCQIIRKSDGSDHGGDGGARQSEDGRGRWRKLPTVVRRDRGYVVTFSKQPPRDTKAAKGGSSADVEDPEMDKINANARYQCQILAAVRAGC